MLLQTSTHGGHGERAPCRLSPGGVARVGSDCPREGAGVPTALSTGEGAATFSCTPGTQLGAGERQTASELGFVVLLLGTCILQSGATAG